MTKEEIIGSYCLLFAFSIASKIAIKSTNDSFTGKYAILMSQKMSFFGDKFSFLPDDFSLDVRPKGVWTYGQGICGRK